MVLPPYLTAEGAEGVQGWWSTPGVPRGQHPLRVGVSLGVNPCVFWGLS